MKSRRYEEQAVINLEDNSYEVFSLEYPEWQTKAACLGAGPDAFFPEPGSSRRTKEINKAKALALCDSCEVQPECSQFAIDAGEKFGTWGGMDEQELRQSRRRR